VKSPTLKRLLARLKDLRRLHSLTQEAFAERAGMSYKYYQALEAGRKPDLRLSTLERLASAYRLEVAELLAPQTPMSRLGRSKKIGKRSPSSGR
jgi:transcriptional regulator with XRE-family HTH domain